MDCQHDQVDSWQVAVVVDHQVDEWLVEQVEQMDRQLENPMGAYIYDTLPVQVYICQTGSIFTKYGLHG